MPKEIWTIGHSTRTLEDFITILQAHNIKTLADVRHFPGSKKYPHFNKDALQESLPKHGISYVHLVRLGGRRKQDKDAPDNDWKHPAFKAYAQYMQTEEFEQGVQRLAEKAELEPVAFMCSEAVWWRCHRGLIADYMKATGWTVLHIQSAGKPKEHPYTAPAVVKNGVVRYRK